MERVARAKGTDVSAGASGCLHLVLPLIKARTEVFACNQNMQLLNFFKVPAQIKLVCCNKKSYDSIFKSVKLLPFLMIFDLCKLYSELLHI